MNRRKSSSVTMTGSIITPFRIRRTSSKATTLFGLVIASVRRLLQKAIGTTLCSLMSDGRQQREDTRIDPDAREVQELDAGVLVRAIEPLGKAAATPSATTGCSRMTRSKSARESTAQVVGSSATTDAVRGFFVSSAISPNIWPGPSSASRNSMPDSPDPSAGPRRGRTGRRRRRRRRRLRGR